VLSFDWLRYSCLSNQTDCSLDDGCVRIWKDVQIEGEEALVMSFNSLPKSCVRPVPLVIHAQEYKSRIVRLLLVILSIFKLASGGDDIVRIWDIASEQCSSSVSLNSTSGCAINSIVSDAVGDIVFLGCSDGSVRFIDLRSSRNLSDRASMLFRNSGRIVNLSLQRKGELEGKLVSSTIRGHVSVCDPRSLRQSLTRFRAHRKTSPLTVSAVHDFAPLLATGSSKQFVNLIRLDGKLINRIRHRDFGFLSLRLSPVNCLAFHPTSLLLAEGGKDSTVSIFTQSPENVALM